MNNIDKIDLITQKPDGTIVLVMIEERSWDGSSSLLQYLQARINSYLSFALDGHLVRRFPSAEGKSVEIRLDCSEEPDLMSLNFIDKIRSKLNDFGVSLEVNVR